MIKEELIQYAKNCINGKITSGKKHKWACQRMLLDFEKADAKLPDFKYYWDEKEAQGIVDWFTYLRHSKGILAGHLINLTTWQKFNLCQLYGWRCEETGYKRFKKSFIEVGRKNAKSQMEAGVALYEISTQAAKNGEVYEYYTAGVKKDQSMIIFSEAILMLKGSPLSTKFKITRDAITHIKTGSFIKALCKEDGKKGDGTNPAGLILDEYHQHQTTEFYDLGLGSNTKESLLMIITTAGLDLTYPCYTQEYEYCSRILNPDVDVENDEYMVDICEIDSEDKIEDEENWIKANPIRMTYREGIDKIRGEFKIAKEIPEKMIAFLTKCMNRWVQQKQNGYMDMQKWKACEIKELPVDVQGMDVYVGFDMSAKTDLTSVAFILPFKSGQIDVYGKEIIKYIVFSHSFIPNQEKLRERIIKDKVPYDAWERLQYLTITDTPIVDQGAVMKYVLDTCQKEKWRIHTLCFDPANASKLMMDLSNEGFDVEEVFQSHKSLNESTNGFREQVYSKNVLYLKNPLLNYAMSNAVIKKSNGLIKIDKDATTKRIDPVDAVLCAFKLSIYHIFGGGFVSAVDRFLESDF